MAEETQFPFRVVCSELVSRSMVDILRRAKQEGFGKVVGPALRQTIQRLRTDPLEFGEKLYELPALKQEVRIGGISAIAVRYAVDPERRVVFIGDCKRLHIVDH